MGRAPRLGAHAEPAGPNRIGPLGLLQSPADGIKFIFKEDTIPRPRDQVLLHLLAPMVSVTPAFMTFAVIPYASQIMLGDHLLNFQVADLNVGLLYIFAIASLGVLRHHHGRLGIQQQIRAARLARSSSQMISYELSMGLSVIGIVMAFGRLTCATSPSAQTAPSVQSRGPVCDPDVGIFIQPLGFLIFMTAAFAETNRLPFDLPEGESEIVAGYHLEYGSMKFALFQMASTRTWPPPAAFFVALYFGSYHGLGCASRLHQPVCRLSRLAGDWLRVLFEMAAFFGKLALLHVVLCVGALDDPALPL